MNKQSHLISIIVPVFNVEKYLERCIDSILAQTYSNYEIILINDGSTDKSPIICNQYANKHSNISVFHQENNSAGVSEARNFGLDKSKGDFITFIDSDDFVDINYLTLLKNNIDKYGVSLSMCSYKKVYTTLNGSFITSTTNLLSDIDSIKMLFENQVNSAVWGKLYNKALFDGIRFPYGKHNEDMFVMPQIINRAKIIAHNTSEAYFYNQENISLCRSKFNYNMLDMAEATKYWYLFVKQHYPTLVEIAKSHYFSVILNQCQYLYKKKDEFGKYKYTMYKSLISETFIQLIKLKPLSFNNKFKVLLIKIGVFDKTYKLIEFLRIRQYT